MTFRLFVGGEPPRGPVVHDFKTTSIQGLPVEMDWDLKGSVANGLFVIGAEIGH